jgi:hypothetical protein
MKKIVFALFFLSALALAFSPPPLDEAKVSLCESTGGVVNATFFDPGGGRNETAGAPEPSYQPVLVFGCECPQNLAWNETSGCVMQVRTESGLIAKIIAFIKKILGGLL